MPAADLDVEAVSHSTLKVLQVTGGEGHQPGRIEVGIASMLALFLRLGALKNHPDQLAQPQGCPEAGDPGQASFGEGVAHLLQKPAAAVHRGEHAAVQAQVHDALEMPVGRILRVSGAIPADRHCSGSETPES